MKIYTHALVCLSAIQSLVAEAQARSIPARELQDGQKGPGGRLSGSLRSGGRDLSSDDHGGIDSSGSEDGGEGSSSGDHSDMGGIFSKEDGFGGSSSDDHGGLRNPCYWSSANGTEALLALIEEECNSFSCPEDVSQDCRAWEPMVEGIVDDILPDVDCDAIDALTDGERDILRGEMKDARQQMKEARTSMTEAEREEKKIMAGSNRANLLGCACCSATGTGTGTGTGMGDVQSIIAGHEIEVAVVLQRMGEGRDDHKGGRHRGKYADRLESVLDEHCPTFDCLAVDSDSLICTWEKGMKMHDRTDWKNLTKDERKALEEEKKQNVLGCGCCTDTGMVDFDAETQDEVALFLSSLSSESTRSSAGINFGSNIDSPASGKSVGMIGFFAVSVEFLMLIGM